MEDQKMEVLYGWSLRWMPTIMEDLFGGAHWRTLKSCNGGLHGGSHDGGGLFFLKSQLWWVKESITVQREPPFTGGLFHVVDNEAVKLAEACETGSKW